MSQRWGGSPYFLRPAPPIHPNLNTYRAAVISAPGGHTRYWLLLLFGDTNTLTFLLVTCLWNLFSLCLSCWILLCSYKYLHVKFAENSCSWEDVSFLHSWVLLTNVNLKNEVSQNKNLIKINVFECYKYRNCLLTWKWISNLSMPTVWNLEFGTATLWAYYSIASMSWDFLWSSNLEEPRIPYLLMTFV